MYWILEVVLDHGPGMSSNRNTSGLVPRKSFKCLDCVLFAQIRCHSWQLVLNVYTSSAHEASIPRLAWCRSCYNLSQVEPNGESDTRIMDLHIEIVGRPFVSLHLSWKCGLRIFSSGKHSWNPNVPIVDAIWWQSGSLTFSARISAFFGLVGGLDAFTISCTTRSPVSIASGTPSIIWHSFQFHFPSFFSGWHYCKYR